MPDATDVLTEPQIPRYVTFMISLYVYFVKKNMNPPKNC